jgi:hypothetical protein
MEHTKLTNSGTEVVLVQRGFVAREHLERLLVFGDLVLSQGVGLQQPSPSSHHECRNGEEKREVGFYRQAGKHQNHSHTHTIVNHCEKNNK